MKALSHSSRVRSTRGAALVEFALVSLAFYLLVAAIVTFGVMIHTAQVAQDAARLAARELALTPLPAGMNFDQALATPGVQSAIFSPDALVVDIDNVPGGDLDAYFASMPAVNRALRPLMIYDQILTAGGVRRLIRVPGALIISATAPSGLTVAVPRVVAKDANGVETIEWLPVLEEVRTDPSDASTGPFSVASSGPVAGVVAVRINVPSQSAALASLHHGASPGDLNAPDVADDGAVTAINSAPGVALNAESAHGLLAHGGPYGLGRVEAFGKHVRPFRRLTSAQAFFRREVFTEQSRP